MMSQKLARIPFIMAVATAAACGATEPTVDESTSSIVVVSADIGEALASAVPRDAVAFGIDVADDARIVYANVDRLKAVDPDADGVVDPVGREARLAALREARDLGLPIILESNEWDVAQVHAVLAELFPTVRREGLQNVTVLARLDAATGEWRVTDTTPAELESLLAPSLARATPTGPDVETDLMTVDATAAAAGTARVNFYIDFAEAAWDGPATVTDWSGNSWSRKLNVDVVKVYTASLAGEKRCAVSWRGTRTKAEWAGDLLNQMYHVRPFWASSSSEARVGYFYNKRLQNQRAAVNKALKDNACTAIGITGHSLGGAMAEIYTTYLAYASSESGISFSKVDDFAAFNPARVGNSTFVSLFPHASLLSSRVYCRIGDPVWKVPSNLEHVGRGSYGCDLWGTDRNPYNGGAPRTNPWFVNNVKTTDVISTNARADWKNHASDYWKKCQSRTSC